MSAIRIKNDVSFRITYRQFEWTELLRSFIVDIGERVAAAEPIVSAGAAAAAAFPRAHEFFTIDPVADTFCLKPEALFSHWDVTSLLVLEAGEFSQIDVADIEGGPRTIRAILELSASGTLNRAEICEQLEGHQRSTFETLLNEGLFTEADFEPREFIVPRASGVYRLQHASLLYRSRSAGILVDPHLHSIYAQPRADIFRRDLEGQVDAILISHFHEDHWSLSTLMMFPKETPIVVPKVPRSTVICGDMEALLRSCGFENVIAVDWYSEPLRFGDIEVHVLPFYGEQPLRFESPSDPCLQNWGNTYVVRTEEYTSWFVVDSGNDVRGSMEEVGRYVKKRIGPVDTLLSNLRRFNVFGPLYINGGLNWMTLSADQMERLPSMASHQVTLGPAGVAELCEAVGAKYYLPYAHWWAELGAPPVDDGDGESETSLMRELEVELRQAGTSTRIVPWSIGDGVLSNSDRKLSRVRILSRTREEV